MYSSQNTKAVDAVTTIHFPTGRGVLRPSAPIRERRVKCRKIITADERSVAGVAFVYLAGKFEAIARNNQSAKHQLAFIQIPFSPGQMFRIPKDKGMELFTLT